VTDAARCPGTTREGAPCPRPAGPSGYCPLHDPEAAAERGRNGRAKQIEAARAERAERAATLRVDTVADLRALLLEAARLAYIEGDTASMLRAVAVGASLIETADLAAEVAELRDLVLARVPGASGKLGATQ
jgi:hypothetical protein